MSLFLLPVFLSCNFEDSRQSVPVTPLCVWDLPWGTPACEMHQHCLCSVCLCSHTSGFPCSWSAKPLESNSSSGIVKLLKSRVHIFGFADLMLSVATTQFCRCGAKAATDDTEMKTRGCVPITLNLQKQAVGRIWPMGQSLPTHTPAHRFTCI